jgi:hypothetical protein
MYQDQWDNELLLGESSQNLCAIPDPDALNFLPRQERLIYEIMFPLGS